MMSSKIYKQKQKLIILSCMKKNQITLERVSLDLGTCISIKGKKQLEGMAAS